MSRYGWVVYRTWIDDDRTTCWVVGPHDISADLEQRLKNGEGDVFRLYADGPAYDELDELYYEGRIIGDYEGFEPLDDFGAGWAGCTNIAYNKEGSFFDYL